MNSSSREILFSVTAADCKFDYIRGTGSGGQKRNKTNSAVRCTHKASGGVGYCEESRHQRDNKEEAFRRMAQSKKFKDWHIIEVSRRTGQQALIDAEVDRQMRQIKIEIKNDDGRWTEVPKNAILDGSEPVRVSHDKNVVVSGEK